MNRASRITELCRMLEAEPGDLFLNYALGMEYLASDDQLANAENQFRLVLEIDPGHIPAFYQLGQLFGRLDRIPEALEFYHKGLVLAREKKNKKAINEFSEAIFMLED